MAEDEENQWKRQKKELQFYNTFFSAFEGYRDTGLNDLGYYVVSHFPERSIPPSDALPDFVLYNGSIFWMVELKSASSGEPNINSEDVKQAEWMGDVAVGHAQDFLREVDAMGETGYEGDVDEVVSSFVYEGLDEEYVKKCRNEWDDCRRQLEALEKEASVLFQEPGSELRLVAGVDNLPESPLKSNLTEGISTSPNPRKHVHLTDGKERKSLAVAIGRIWGEKGAEEETRVTATDVQTYFASRRTRRGVDRDDILKALSFLHSKDACRKEQREIEEDDNIPVYVFDEETCAKALNIGSLMDEEDSTSDEWF